MPALSSLPEAPNIDITLVVPPGRVPEIFPWGVQLISDFLKNRKLARKVQTLDLSGRSSSG